MTLPRPLSLSIRLVLYGAFPVALLLTALRLVAAPAFSEAQLHHGGLPEDRYGMATVDRLSWSRFISAYLEGAVDEGALASAVLPPGQAVPDREPGVGCRAFTPRELRHLADVKRLLGVTTGWWMVSLLALVLALCGLRIHGGWSTVRQDLQRAASITLVVLTAGTLGAALQADRLLNLMHRAFFAGNSYLFYTSDTLVRVYPEQYWRNAVVCIWLFSLLTAAAVLGATRAHAVGARKMT
jgi:integral membrane protein (TIGR01906 family)